MKMIFKKLAAIIVAFVVVISFATIAMADANTGYVPGPSLKLQKWVRGDTHKLTPGGPGYPRGEKSTTLFKEFGSLPSSFAPDNHRKIEIYLMEEDKTIFNADEEVKYYTGTFTGRKLTSMQYMWTVTPGNLESNVTAEMYIKCKVHRTQNPNLTDPSNGTTIGQLFKYKIEIKSN